MLENRRSLGYAGFLFFLGCLGLLPCFLKIKCTNEVIDNLNFSDLNARLVLVRRVNLGDINFIHKLPENGSVKLLHIGVLSDRCNELSDVDFLLLLFLDFLPQMFDKICTASGIRYRAFVPVPQHPQIHCAYIPAEPAAHCRQPEKKAAALIWVPLALIAASRSIWGRIASWTAV